MKTGIKFKPCNVGTAEAHNRRDAAYCKAVERKYGHTYFWDDRRHLNKSWTNPYYPKPLPEVFEDIKVMVKEKTGRAMQCKTVKVKDSKTGKEKERVGSSPIREGCPPIKPDTRIEDFDIFKQWLAGKGITVISIDLHHDEGHADPETDDLRPNHHAHVIVDWMDHSTGKSVKLSKEDCKEMQTVLAQSLGMERGEPKEDTGIEGLSAIEYKEKMALEHARKLEKDNAEKEKKGQELDRENSVKAAENERLEKERKKKKRKLDEETGSHIRNSLAKIVGMGDYAEKDRIYAEKDARYEEKDKKYKEMEKQVEAIPEMAKKLKAKTINDLTVQHNQELKDLEDEHKADVQNLITKNTELKNSNSSLQSENRKLRDENMNLKKCINEFWSMLSQWTRKIINYFRDFAKSYRRELYPLEVDHVAEYLRPDPEEKSSSLKMLLRLFLDDKGHKKSSEEIDRIHHNLPSILNEIDNPRSRGRGL